MPQASVSTKSEERARIRREVNAALRSYYLLLMEVPPPPVVPKFLQEMQADDSDAFYRPNTEDENSKHT
jgi:hypothetical protein